MQIYTKIKQISCQKYLPKKHKEYVNIETKVQNRAYFYYVLKVYADLLNPEAMTVVLHNFGFRNLGHVYKNEWNLIKDMLRVIKCNYSETSCKCYITI